MYYTTSALTALGQARTYTSSSYVYVLCICVCMYVCMYTYTHICREKLGPGGIGVVYITVDKSNGHKVGATYIICTGIIRSSDDIFIPFHMLKHAISCYVHTEKPG